MNPMIIYPQSNQPRPATVITLLGLALAAIFGCGMLLTGLSRDNVELRQREAMQSQALAEKDARIADLKWRLSVAEHALAGVDARTNSNAPLAPTTALESLLVAVAGFGAFTLTLGGITFALYRAASANGSNVPRRTSAS